jgi:glucose-6-phosphate 1-dehydrogenase
VIRGQYMESHVRGEFMKSYRSEDGVPDVSRTETYVAMKLYVDNCMQGDSTLYARGDAVEEAWKFVNPVLRGWREDKEFPLHGYPCGTWGPEQADLLIENDGQTWRYPCKNLADDGNYCEL